MGTISSFTSLTTITDRLLLYDNDKLTTISGFNVLATVTGSIQIGNSAISVIDGNDALTSLPTFSALENLGTLHIVENDELTTIPTFAGLIGIKGNILINNNAKLTSVSGFGALETVGGNFTITNNVALETVLGFGGLTTLTGNLTVQGNIKLASCCGLFSIAPGGTTSFSGNLAGCNDKAQITCVSSLTIDDPADVTDALKTLTRITGDLTIGGTITTFPDFAALTVVEGNLTISGLTALTDKNLTDIFLVLEEVQGNLLIQNNANVLTITGFVALSEVKGNVSIGSATSGEGNGALTAAPALDALTTIGGSLLIANNGVLTTAPALSGLTNLVGDFTVQDNARLASCCALLRVFDDVVRSGVTSLISGNAAGCEGETETRTACAPPPVILDKTVTITADGEVPDNVTEVTRITGNLTISGTISSFPDFAALSVVQGNLTIDNITTGTLTDLSAIFPTLDSIYGALIIQNQSVVATITGFASLDTIGGNLSINTNTSLTSIPSFSTLDDIGNDFSIDNNDVLTSISGFDALETVGNDFIITRNVALETLPTFATITSIGKDFTVTGNTTLSECCALLRFVDGTVAPVGTTGISGNAAGCSASTEITNACLPALTIAVDADIPGDAGTLTRIRGNLTIGGTITNFPDFAALTLVDGNLVISGLTDTNLTDLGSIFPVLEEVQGDLLIQNNANVATITGFVALSEVDGSVSIGGVGSGDGNAALTAAPDLNALTTIGGNLLIANNGVLTTAPALSGLTSLTGNLTVQDNAQLASCCALLRVVDDVVTGSATTTISGNTGECVDVAAIRTACTLPEVIHDADLTIASDGDLLGTETTITRITGNLTISGTINSFPDFAALSVVQGNLTIDDITTGTLTDLSAIFPALDSVYGNLQIQNQTVVTTITGFAELDTIGGNLSINDNTSLTTLPPFDAIIGVGGGITIEDNAALTPISGFTLLKTIGGNIFIADNALLASVSGFDVLESIESDLIFHNNAKLTTLPTFNVLESVGGNFGITSNALLTNFSGFDALESILTDIIIVGNVALETLPTFATITSIGNDFTVTGNTTLSECCALLRFVDGTVAPVGTTDISGNAAGCNAVTEITNACLPALTIAVDADIPSDAGTLTRIRGDLTIGGTIATFPDFAALTLVEGNLVISGLTDTNLTALGSIFPVLEEVQGDLLIQNNANVATITGFAALSEVDGNVSIGGVASGDGNAALTAAPALNALTTIGGNLVIANNGVLTTAPVLSGLTSLTGNLTVQDNAQLSSCCALLRVVDDVVTSSATTTISGNATECASVAAINVACDTTTPDPVLGLPSVGEGLRFYPNPASQTLYIEGISQETSLIIRTLSGQTLLRTTLRQNQAIDLTALPQGVYLLTLQNGQERLTRRLVIGF